MMQSEIETTSSEPCPEQTQTQKAVNLFFLCFFLTQTQKAVNLYFPPLFFLLPHFPDHHPNPNPPKNSPLRAKPKGSCSSGLEPGQRQGRRSLLLIKSNTIKCTTHDKHKWKLHESTSPFFQPLYGLVVKALFGRCVPLTLTSENSHLITGHPKGQE